MDNDPTVGWLQVGRQLFRRNEIYSLSWSNDIDLDKLNIVTASFGGPIALNQPAIKTDKPIIEIFSASGQKMSAIKCEIHSKMVGFSWTCTEDLLVVGEKELYLYDIFGNLNNIIGVDIKDCKIIDFKCFNTINSYTNSYVTGIVILTSKLKFILIKDIYNSKLQKFPDIPGTTISSPPPNSWCVISNDKKCFIYVTKGLEIFQLSLDREPQIMTYSTNKITSTIVSIVPSFNHENLALVTETGTIVLYNSDLKRVIYEYQSDINTAPKYLAWCSNYAIVTCWENLLILTIDGDTLLNYEYPPFHFVQECDGLRIITPQKHDFLQLVPKSVKEIFGVDATGPSTILYEASISFYKDKNQHADEYIKTIKNKNQLEIAISDCIDAASHVYEYKYQKTLLRAALFGRYFEEYPNPSAFVKMCQTLRVLNAIRHHNIAVPVTYIQYQALTPLVVINRLVLRRHFALAIEVCKYLSIPEVEGNTKILLYWALYKVKQIDIDDETIAKIIANKLGEASGISYAEIARCAIQSGRPNLAIKLLDYETKASEQVPLYMQMKNPDLALKKAIESGDSDLIYMVLLSSKDKFNNISDFMKDISKNPVAMSLMLQYYRQNDINKLCDIFDQENMNIDHALTLTKVAYKQEDVNEKIKILDEAQRLFRNKDDLSLSLISDEIKLLKKQADYEKAYRLQLKGKSMYDTLGELIKASFNKEAEELRKEFKISDSDKSWWFIKIKALSEGNLWEELEKFSKSKKSPIGYEPFVEVCMKENNLPEAKKYYPKVSAENRVKCLILMKNLSEALDLSFETKDEFGINMVLAKCDSNQKALIEKAKALRNALHTKK